MMTAAAQLDALKRRLQERTKAVDVSLRKASIQAGLAPGYAVDLVNGRNKRPSIEAVKALADALDCDVEYLLGSQELPRRPPGTPANEAVPASTGRRLIPLYRACGRGAQAEGPVDMVAALPSLEHVPGAYAVVITDSLMSPRYEVGDIVFVHPGLPVRVGDYAVIRLTTGGLFPRRVVSTDGDTWRGHRLNPVETEEIRAAEIGATHRIVGSSSVL